MCYFVVLSLLEAFLFDWALSMMAITTTRTTTTAATITTYSFHPVNPSSSSSSSSGFFSVVQNFPAYCAVQLENMNEHK